MFGRRSATVEVLRGIDLTVAEHEVVVLIGASGSGKSTCSCVNLLERVSDGTIHLDGTDITDPRADADAFRQRIGRCSSRTTCFRI